ncbi:type II 3-dehydroquinate dehydratase [Olsenella intestinalis]|uniref:type II 3-dehydroquinate dehydratase n=1 Tax=Olsenella intestinalis TaxID=2930083 RepID=UPI00200C4326|nr:type II 3-dehydroquinate dehydratase [Olsenella intestinalis]
MGVNEAAAEVLRSVGGKRNVLANSLCMTRLRIRVANPTIVDKQALNSIEGVLGTTTRGADGFEVVFGPRVVADVFESFAGLTGLPPTIEAALPVTSFSPSRLSVQITSQGGQVASAADMASTLDDFDDDEDAPEAPAPADDDAAESDASELERMLLGGEDDFEDEADDLDDEDEDGLRLLVINGPNINMLGVREPDVYGKQDFSALLELCKQVASKEGFVDCLCFQSNHEGDIVDKIQDAYQVFDGIVINPGAYTHTSVAILDALKAVSIPAIEVHISNVDEREEFRKVSYVRAACFETISGMGIDGYRKAIEDMASHLRG